MKTFTKILTECLLEAPEMLSENCDVNNFMSANQYLMFMMRLSFS